MGKLICNNKKYRTRSGFRVTIDRKRMADSTFPVIGWIYAESGRRYQEAWTSDGHGQLGGCNSPWDLVEVVND